MGAVAGSVSSMVNCRSTAAGRLLSVAVPDSVTVFTFDLLIGLVKVPIAGASGGVVSFVPDAVAVFWSLAPAVAGTVEVQAPSGRPCASIETLHRPVRLSAVVVAPAWDVPKGLSLMSTVMA